MSNLPPDDPHAKAANGHDRQSLAHHFVQIEDPDLVESGHPLFKCGVGRVLYNRAQHTGILYMPDGDCCDMRGCIDYFVKVDPKAKVIVTVSGDWGDTIYKKVLDDPPDFATDDDWVAIPSWHICEKGQRESGTRIEGYKVEADAGELKFALFPDTSPPRPRQARKPTKYSKVYTTAELDADPTIWPGKMWTMDKAPDGQIGWKHMIMKDEAPRRSKPNGHGHSKVEWFSDLTYDPEASQWLIAGVLPWKGFGVLYGKPKSKKSFIATDMALAIASGRKWAGLSTSRCTCVIVAAEGAAGMRKRLVANRDHNDVPANAPIILIADKPNLGTKYGDADRLIEIISAAVHEQPGFIIIDTLAGTLGGEEENGPGMDNFIAAAERIYQHFGCFVLPVHHEGWAAARLRGRSTLPAASDVTLRIERIDSLVSTMTIENAKDFEDGKTFTVNFRSIEMGFDPMLDRESTTLIVDSVEALDSPVSTKKSVSAAMRKGLDILIFAVDQRGVADQPLGPDSTLVRTVDKEVFRSLYYERRGDLDNEEARRKAFNRFLADGLKASILNTKVLADQRVLIWRT